MRRYQTILLTFFLLSSAACTQAAEDTHYIAVSGAGHTATAADTALLRLGVEIQASTAVQAMAQNGTQTNQVLAALAKLGLDDESLSTQSITLNPRYNFTRNKQGEQQRELLGYTATNIISAKIEQLDLVGPSIDTAIKAGANRVDNIQFTVKDPTAALNLAREAAWQDAHSQAQQLAALAKTSLGPVISIETYQNTQGPVQMMEARALRSDTPVMGGQQKITVNVNVRWALD